MKVIFQTRHYRSHWIQLLNCAAIILCLVSSTTALPLSSFRRVALQSARQTVSRNHRWRQLNPHSYLQSSNHSLLRDFWQLFATGNSEKPLMSRRTWIWTAVGGALLAFPPMVEFYSRSGIQEQEFSSMDILANNGDAEASKSDGTSWGSVQHVTLAFHGAGGQDQYTDALMKALKESCSSSPSSKGSSKVLMMDWSDYSSNLFQASYNGQRFGRTVARKILSKAPNIQSIHLIGISVGSFAADAACVALKKEKTSSPFVQLTLLDPFTQRGIFQLGYGTRKFGADADYVEQYLNTDDPVPSTNAPLDQAACFDITDLRPPELFGHDWPVVYYTEKLKSQRLKQGTSSDAAMRIGGLVPPESRLERGVVIQVD